MLDVQVLFVELFGLRLNSTGLDDLQVVQAGGRSQALEAWCGCFTRGLLGVG